MYISNSRIEEINQSSIFINLSKHLNKILKLKNIIFNNTVKLATDTLTQTITSFPSVVFNF